MGLGIMFVLSMGYLLVSLNKKAPTISVWENISVGRDSAEKITAKLGQPESTTKSSGGADILNYPGPHSFWPNQVYIQDKTSALVKQRMINKVAGELQQYLTKLGTPDLITASNDDLPATGFRLYVFVSQGLALNASPTSGAIFEIWYFQPTTLEKFQSQFKNEIKDWKDAKSY